MLVLFESWLPSDWLESLWKGTRSASFDGQPKHLFTDMVILFRGWLRAPLCGKSSTTLWWSALIWKYESICFLLCRAFSCDSGSVSADTSATSASVASCHLLKISINTEEHPRTGLPHSNRRAAKHRHGYSQPVLTKCFPLTGQFVWFLFLFYWVGIDVLDFYGALHCHYALCNQ